MLGLQKMAPGAGNMALGELPEPVPGPGEVVINVKAAGICGSDLHIRQGSMKYTLRYPVVIGHEYAGVVSALGEGISDLPLGERVTSETLFSTCGVCLACRAGAYNQCAQKLVIGYYYNGCFASHIKIPRRLVHRLPDNVSFNEGALVEPMACCVHAVTELTSIRPGNVVVVAGPGSIGLVCVQLAKASGAYVICTGTRSDASRLAMARQLGADQSINIEDESLSDIVNGLTDGRGADAYIECSGHPAAARSGLTITRRGGQYTQVGIFEHEFALDFAQIVYRELKVQGSVGSRRPSWLTALNLLASGQVKVAPLASRVYPLAQWEEAFRVAQDKLALKVLLVPD